MSETTDPITSAQLQNAQEHAQRASAENLNSATVMMVDDEPINLDVVQVYLHDPVASIVHRRRAPAPGHRVAQVG